MLTLACTTAIGGSSIFASTAYAEEMQVFSLDTMVVTASRVETSKADTPANITVISQEKLEDSNYASIENKMTNKTWGEGFSESNGEGELVDHQDIDSIVGVTPNKTYTLLFDCCYTNGVTFSWGKAINDMKPTVEDY